MGMQKIKQNDLEQVAINIIKKINGKKTKNAIVVAMYGDLGSGKTTLTQNICKKLGVKNKIISPTFVIMKKYKIESEKFKNLIHIDTYRLDKNEDMINLGWEEIVSNNENIIIVEWPERIEKLIPKDCVVIRLTHIDDENRGIVIE